MEIMQDKVMVKSIKSLQNHGKANFIRIPITYQQVFTT